MLLSMSVIGTQSSQSAGRTSVLTPDEVAGSDRRLIDPEATRPTGRSDVSKIGPRAVDDGTRAYTAPGLGAARLETRGALDFARMPAHKDRAFQRLRRARQKILVGLLIGLAGPAASITTAVIDHPAATPPDCIARDSGVAQLVRTEPELVPILERQHDPLDHDCGSAAAIVQSVASAAP
jgi:hypothetical protein